jgi:hypothetical protein
MAAHGPDQARAGAGGAMIGTPEAQVIPRPGRYVLYLPVPGRDHYDLRRAVRGASGSSYFYRLSALQYYVPTIAAISLLGSCYSQLAIVLSTRRQNGILKRVRAAPLHEPSSPSAAPAGTLDPNDQCSIRR